MQSLLGRYRLLLQLKLLMLASVVWSGKSEPVLFSRVLSWCSNPVVSRLEAVLLFSQRRPVSVSVNPWQLLVCAHRS